MRRITSLVAGLGLLGSVGCHHVAGFCDCTPPVCPCAIYGLHPAADYSHHAAVATTAAPVVVEPPKAEGVAVPIAPIAPGRD